MKSARCGVWCAVCCVLCGVVVCGCCVLCAGAATIENRGPRGTRGSGSTTTAKKKIRAAEFGYGKLRVLP